MFAKLRYLAVPALLLLGPAGYGSPQVRVSGPARAIVPGRLTPNPDSSGVAPQPLAPSPASGSGLSQTFTFTFTDQNGWQNFAVVDILINTALNGQNACYVALIPTGPSTGVVYLVPDSGPTASLPHFSLPGTGSLNNSQCTISGTGASVTANSTTLTLTLPITFASSFAGHQGMFLAAQDTSGNDSGWQPLAAWTVPGAAAVGPAVTGMSPARTTGANQQTYAFTVTDSNGWTNLSVVDVLINNALNGESACYFALVVSPTSEGTLYLVGDGTPGSPTYAGVENLPTNTTLSNSQCSLNLGHASVNAAGNTLILELPITFSNTFTGNKIFYVGAREASATSGWQIVGTTTLP